MERVLLLGGEPGLAAALNLHALSPIGGRGSDKNHEGGASKKNHANGCLDFVLAFFSWAAGGGREGAGPGQKNIQCIFVYKKMQFLPRICGFFDEIML